MTGMAVLLPSSTMAALVADGEGSSTSELESLLRDDYLLRLYRTEAHIYSAKEDGDINPSIPEKKQYGLSRDTLRCSFMAGIQKAFQSL